MDENLFGDDIGGSVIEGIRTGTVNAAASITEDFLRDITGTQRRNFFHGYSNQELLILGLVAYLIIK